MGATIVNPIVRLVGSLTKLLDGLNILIVISPGVVELTLSNDDELAYNCATKQVIQLLE